MAGLGLSPGQPKILNFLMLHNNCMQKQLAASCDIEAASISKLLNNMESQGLIERRPLEEDKRAVAISITEKGREANESMNQYLNYVNQTSLQGFSEEEAAAFQEYLCRMYYNLTGNRID